MLSLSDWFCVFLAMFVTGLLCWGFDRLLSRPNTKTVGAKKDHLKNQAMMGTRNQVRDQVREIREHQVLSPTNSNQEINSSAVSAVLVNTNLSNLNKQSVLGFQESKPSSISTLSSKSSTSPSSKKTSIIQSFFNKKSSQSLFKKKPVTSASLAKERLQGLGLGRSQVRSVASLDS